MTRPIHDLTNQRFGKLVARRFLGLGRGIWECQCDCGKTCQVPSGGLRFGSRVSCGCSAPRCAAHGYSGTDTHASWIQMRRRCTDPNHASYKWYGGRGVTFDPRWAEFTVFFEDMGLCPDRNHTLDRIDPALGYSKENCHWVPLKGTARRNTPMIGNQTLSEYAKQNGLSYHTAYARWRKGKITP